MAQLLTWIVLLTPVSVTAAQVEDVDIYYDSHSLAHVFGESDEAALFGLGFHQMREFPIGTLDRLWRFSGRFSEIVGPSYLDQDYRVRLWEVPEMVARDRQALPPEILRLLEAFAAGVEAGRAWWRSGSTPPTASLRLRTVLGTTSDPTHLELNVDPLPDYLNQGFHSFALNPDDPDGTHPGYDPADVHLYITRVVDRLFDPSQRITVDHVLSLGLAFGSSPALLNRASELAPRAEGDPPSTKGWAISSTATGGGVVTLFDPHTSVQSLTNRPYVVQIHGDTFQATGLIMPGFPAPFFGFNESLSWTGANLRGGAVVQTTWEVALKDAPGPLRFRYGARLRPPKLGLLGTRVPAEGDPAEVRFEKLQVVPETLAYYDPVDRTSRTQARARFYVPDPDELGLPNDRFPIVSVNGESADGLTVVPTAGDVVRFKQHAFTTAINTWEFFIRVGRARHIDDAPAGEEQVVDVLSDGLWSWENGMIFADYKDRFYSVSMAHVPIQGPDVRKAVAPRDYTAIGSGALVLDGSLPGARWQGFHPLATMAQIGPTDVTGPEVWLCMVATLDHVEVGPLAADPNDDRFTTADLDAFPPEITRSPSRSNWSQVRARELLMQGNLTPGALVGAAASAAHDLDDAWAATLWDFFKRARDIKVSELGPQPDVDRFIAFIEAYRHLAEDGITCDPASDFAAHPYSLVTVYMTLLKSRYTNELALRSGLTPLQAGLGTDALHSLYGLGPTALARPTYDPNIDTLWAALTWTTSLWQLGSGPQGLRNHDVLVNQLLAEPWSSDPRFNDTQAFVDGLASCGPQSFDGDMAGTAAIRWGEVNVLALTPHLIPPARALLFDSDPELIRSSLYMALRPDLLGTLDPGNTSSLLRRLKHPVYQDQPVVAFPMGGTNDTMLPSSNPNVFTPTRPNGYSQSVYVWNTVPGDSLYLVPHERGSQALLLVELSNPPGNATASFLCATAGTEITRAFLPHQNRYATSADFANRVWNDFETDEAALAATAIHHTHLTYTPVP